jgi:hypothetical protein
VALVDGSAPTLEEMAERHERGETFWGYALGEHGRIEVALLDAPRFIDRDALVEITLDNDRAVRATPDHEFVLRDGRRAQAGQLRPGNSLMPLYRAGRHGMPAEAVYQPMVETTGMPLNHKVVAVRDLPGDHDVYCLTVPGARNFALDAGVFVANCGLIVNVTPLEPTWEGYLTLEISNTTPLPAKVYGGEGIAQLLFFEGDEEPEVAYADRQGKYMKQVGVTLPKL